MKTTSKAAIAHRQVDAHLAKAAKFLNRANALAKAAGGNPGPDGNEGLVKLLQQIKAGEYTPGRCELLPGQKPSDGPWEASAHAHHKVDKVLTQALKVLKTAQALERKETGGEPVFTGVDALIRRVMRCC